MRSIESLKVKLKIVPQGCLSEVVSKQLFKVIISGKYR